MGRGGEEGGRKRWNIIDRRVREHTVKSTKILFSRMRVSHYYPAIIRLSLPLCFFVYASRESLLRLSSKPYTFATYHEAVHLCNTAVQERYDHERRRRRSHDIGNGVELLFAERSVRDQGWDCHKLNEYLK